MSLLDEAMAVLIESYQNRSMPDDFTVEKIIARYEPETEGECPEPFCRNGIMGAGITRRSCPVCRAQQKADEGTGLEGEDNADRGRVLAAARELAEAVGSDLMYVEGATVSDRTLAALASFREVDHG